MIKGMVHSSIFVDDLQRSIDFYCNIIGFKLLKRNKGEEVEVALLMFPSQNEVGLELVCGREAEVCDGRINHLAFSVNNIEEVLVLLKNNNVNLINETPLQKGKNRKIAFFRGPDGEKLELIEDKV